MFYSRRLYVTIAQNKEDRQKNLQLQFANFKIVPVQHAVSHDSIPAAYHVPNYDWFQNQMHVNPVYLCQQNGMVHFLGTQACSSNAPTVSKIFLVLFFFLLSILLKHCNATKKCYFRSLINGGSWIIEVLAL